MPKISDRLQHAWNAFRYGEQVRYRDYGPGFYYAPSRPIRRIGTERSIVMALYNRIAMDVANIGIKHVRLDENDRYLEDIDSKLNLCLQVEANIDQTSRAFMQDVVLSMLEEGVVAVVPVVTTLNPTITGSYDIEVMRTGKIVQWYPEYVTVNLYNQETGLREDVTLPKSTVAIIENPFYAIMNEPNSTLQRLIRKLNLLDAIDEQSGAGKLDLIVQLPYTIRSEARRLQAKERKKDIEMQLAGSKYGIAYIDAAEHVTQLNRSVDNNLMKQIEYLTSMLYSQLGMSEDLLKGVADEKVNLNYINNTIEPIISAICNEYKRKFLTKTARSQRQTIKFFREPFKLVPVDNLAEIADKFTRNEILSSNEIRQVIGMKPSNDPKADELRNSNMPHEGEDGLAVDQDQLSYEQSAGNLNDLDAQLSALESSLRQSGLLNLSLQHYASPYYDPVKAHEYYEEHKHLKGRTSSAGLNDQGREASQFVKKQLQARKKARIEQAKTKRDTTIKESSSTTKTANELEKEKTKQEIDSFAAQMQSQIEAIRSSMSSLSKDEKARVAEKVAKLRESVAVKRQDLNAAYKEFSAKNTQAHKVATVGARELYKQETDKAKEDYQRELEAEMGKIQSETSFQGKKRKR